MRDRLASWVLVGLLTAGMALAGCLGDEPAPPPVEEEPPQVIPDIVPQNRTVHRTGCALYSQAYLVPATLFAGVVPDGFAVAGGSKVPGTTNLAVRITLCGAVDEEVQPGNFSALGAETIEAVAMIPVEPPADQRDENLTINYLPVALAVQGEGLHERYLEWGFTAQAANITQTHSENGPVFQSHLAWTDATGGYRIDAAGQVADTLASQTAYRLWAAQDGKAVGSVMVETATGTHAGTGASALAYDGAGPIPPNVAGTTTYSTGIDGFTRYIALGAPVPALMTGGS